MSTSPTLAAPLASPTASTVAASGEMTVKSWLVTFLIQMIPVVGLVMLFVWGFSESERPARRTYARAVLLLFAILVGLYLVLAVVVGVSAFGLLGS